MSCLWGECSGLVGLGCWNLDGKEVGDVFGICVLDSEVVDNKTEFDGACCVFPEAGSDGAFRVSVWFQYFYQLVVGDFASLGQAVHAFLYFDVHVVVVDEWLNLSGRV